MEMKHQGMIVLGVLLILILAVMSFVTHFVRRKRKYHKGVKVAGDLLWEEDPYFKRRVRKYKRWSLYLFGFLFVAIFACFTMFTRPFETEVTKEEQYNRDIMLCLDISSSVDELNYNLMGEMKKVVKKLDGERIGIVIFNTSPSLLCPLTNDTDYIIEQLDNIETALDRRIASGSDYGENNSNDIFDDAYWTYFLTGGTLVGNEERGSSLIGDGLAASVFHFSDWDKTRTRIVIFSTDNDLYGEPLCTLTEAAQLCRQKNVTVYGIGTEKMYGEDMREMKDAMEITGGKFYLEEPGTYQEIVKDIESHSKSQMKGKTISKDIEKPQKGFLLLLTGVIGMYLAAAVTKR